MKKLFQFAFRWALRLSIYVLLAGVALLAWSYFAKPKVVYLDFLPSTPDSLAGYRAEIYQTPAIQTNDAVGVALLPNGNLLALHRADKGYGNREPIQKPVVIEFDRETKSVVKEWGAGMFKSPHGLAVSPKGEVWITDTETNLIYRFTRDGALLQTIGEPHTQTYETLFRLRTSIPIIPAPHRPYLFARPTDVAFTKNGGIIVSDGYRNYRIAAFDSSGKFLWEESEFGNRENAFHLPHGITTDSSGRIYVADRANSRIKVYSPEGELISIWQKPEIGRPFGLYMVGEKLYVADGGNVLDDPTKPLQSQVVILDLNGNVIERFGEYGKEQGNLAVPHDIVADEEGNIYVADLKNNRFVTFKKALP
ncbi:MAG: peptidyl-alpha-hydroxyglycine alpha-amidating lyase family protein [Chloroherpetonaceae bacterium]|nr:peptidyl-alpha-hydroxyglycine alpha-amidating lyase family protein [Chloroherpetonaceae bacterium]